MQTNTTNSKRLLPEQLLKQFIKLNKDYLNLCEIASRAKKLSFPSVQSQIAPFREQSSLHNGGLEWLRLLVFACAKPSDFTHLFSSRNLPLLSDYFRSPKAWFWLTWPLGSL